MNIMIGIKLLSAPVSILNISFDLSPWGVSHSSLVCIHIFMALSGCHNKTMTVLDQLDHHLNHFGLQ